MSKDPMIFIRNFLALVEDQGIFDEYNEDEMEVFASDELHQLIEEAYDLLPERIPGIQAATLMRGLGDEERTDLILNDPEVVIDARAIFRKNMVENRAASGLLKNYVNAVRRGDSEEADKLFDLATKYTEEVNDD